MYNVNNLNKNTLKLYHYRIMNEYKLDDKNVRDQIKYLASKKGMTMLKLKELVNTKYNKQDSIRNLGNKLRTGTFRLSEFVEITDILGYEIYIREK